MSQTIRMPSTRISVWVAVAGLLAVHAGLALWAVAQKSVTYDEILHVTGGFFYNRAADFRIHPENGVLPQRWAALPAALSNINPPTLTDNEYWRTSDAGVVSYQFFYEAGHDHWPVLMRARAMMVCFSLATGLLIFAWARRLFGDAAGLFALALFTLDPNMLAHAPLATSDMAATFFLLASTGAFWRLLGTPRGANLALSAGAFGLACVAKFSAVLLPGIFALLFAWHCARATPDERRFTLRRLPMIAAVHLVVASAIIWAFYGFRYSAFAPGVPAAAHFIAPWEAVLPHIGVHAWLVEFGRAWRLLPEAFLYGYAWVVHSMQARSAFLAGDYSVTGWPSFFPLTFVWKTPLALLSAIALGCWVVAGRWVKRRELIARDCTAVAPLLVLFLVYWAVSITSKLNIGHRHLLPTYPAVFILAGGLAASQVWTRIVRILVPMALGLAQAIASARVAPHYLAFFNSIAGGPTNGWRLLVDSSLDWGQDLPALRAWLDRHVKGEPVFLSYFGAGEPRYFGLDARRLEFVNSFKFPPTYTKLEAGIYCISATMLQHVYSPVRGAWTLELEREYQQLRQFEPVFASGGAGDTPAGASVSTEDWQKGLRRFNRLRFARLCHVLRTRNPDAHAGHSILIYRLDAADVSGATAGTLVEWRLALERAAAQP